jgi:hypothetical protein
MKFGEEGQSMVEFALVLPVLMIVLTGICSFGIALNQYMVLTNATNAGARAFALSRGQTTPALAGTNPCAYAVQTVENAAPSLNASNMTFTILYTPSGTTNGGSATTYSTSCSGLSLKTADMVQVKVAYPVVPILAGLGSMTLNLMGNSTELVN